MHIKIPLVAAIAIGLSSHANSFTLDAVGYAGSELSLNPASVLVPGYGELVFEAGTSSALVVNSAYETVAETDGGNLRFDPADAVKIISVCMKPVNPDGTATEEERYDFHPQIDLITPLAFRSFLQEDEERVDPDSGEIVGVQIPEPTAAIFGLIGIAALGLFHRRNHVFTRCPSH